MAGALMLGCSDSDEPNNNGVDTGALLAALPANVILPTYQNYATAATALTAAIQDFAANQDDPHLATAQQAWRDTRTPWESSEAFGFGPADVGGFDANSDDWPVSTVDIETILASVDVLDKAYVDALPTTSKGFHAIEYVLFGTTAKVAADFTARELEYLDAAAQSLQGQAEGVRDAWDPAAGDYSGQLANAGEAGSLYGTRADAFEEVVQGMVDIVDELANEKIAGAAGPPVDLTLEESRFSANSTDDFTHNVQGVRNIYLGSYAGNSGLGLTDRVAEQDPAVDADVRAKLTAAEAAIADLTPTFADALVNSPAKVQTAMDAVNALRDVLDTDVRPLVTN